MYFTFHGMSIINYNRSSLGSNLYAPLVKSLPYTLGLSVSIDYRFSFVLGAGPSRLPKVHLTSFLFVLVKDKRS